MVSVQWVLRKTVTRSLQPPCVPSGSTLDELTIINTHCAGSSKHLEFGEASLRLHDSC